RTQLRRQQALYAEHLLQRSGRRLEEVDDGRESRDPCPSIGYSGAPSPRDPSAPLDLEALAAAAYMSRYHFLRVFEDVTSISPARFLAALRMHQAKRLLLETTLAVTSICFEVGYNSLGTFARLFTDSVGVNPSSFRKLGEAGAGRSLEALTPDNLQGPLRSGRTISGSVRGPADFHGVIFLGAFSSPIPHQRPVN